MIVKHNHLLLHLAFNTAVISSPSVIISALIASRWAGVALSSVTFAGLDAGFTEKRVIRGADQEIDEVSDINNIVCEEMQKHILIKNHGH